jgi:hypothetical protein
MIVNNCKAKGNGFDEEPGEPFSSPLVGSLVESLVGSLVERDLKPKIAKVNITTLNFKT